VRYSSELSVNLHFLGENINSLQKIAPNNKIIFMVKGDAYGHGILKVSEYAYSKHKIDHFGVASLAEAIHLRATLPNIKIYVFSDVEIENHATLYFHERLIPVLSCFEDLNTFLDHENFDDHPFALKFDTGMNRLGFKQSETKQIINKLNSKKCKSIQHILTHFSHSFFKIKDGDKTNRQYKAFKEIKTELQNSFEILESSVSNSGAIEQGFGLDESHVRPGLMLYGPASVGGYKNEKRLWQGRIISSLKTRVLATKKVKKGDPIGYGGHVVHKDGIILIIPLGYADGILTYYSGYKFSFKEYTAKLLGRINMDLSFIHIDCINPELISRNDEILLWNDDQDKMLDFCTQTKTIPYQVFTAITSRVPRLYYDK
jgi:alanine racemase